MARDRASIRLNMWADDDWRALTADAQWLYMLLLSHPTLSYAGVAEWRPGRLAAMAKGRTTDDVMHAAGELSDRLFVVVDESTEEVLIRSFVKHDGLMKQPKLVVSMVNAYAAIASKRLREVLAFEVQKLRDREPDLNAWSVSQVQTILKADSVDVHTFTPGFTPGLTLDLTPDVTPGFTPNGGHGLGLPTTTATSTATSSTQTGEAKLKETRLPKDWTPTAAHFELAKERRVDIQAEVDAFRLHAETHDRHAARWNAAFTTWLKKAKPGVKAPVAVTPQNEWMFR